MKEKPDFYKVNLFKPKPGYMQDEVTIILFVLVAWGVATFGFQVLLWLLAKSAAGTSFLTKVSVFTLPFHFWFTGQFLPLWFIVLCIAFNMYIDRLTEQHSRRRDRSYE